MRMMMITCSDPLRAPLLSLRLHVFVHGFLQLSSTGRPVATQRVQSVGHLRCSFELICLYMDARDRLALARSVFLPLDEAANCVVKDDYFVPARDSLQMSLDSAKRQIVTTPEEDDPERTRCTRDNKDHGSFPRRQTPSRHSRQS
jgi:hypothetical protein